MVLVRIILRQVEIYLLKMMKRADKQIKTQEAVALSNKLVHSLFYMQKSIYSI